MLYTFFKQMEDLMQMAKSLHSSTISMYKFTRFMKACKHNAFKGLKSEK